MSLIIIITDPPGNERADSEGGTEDKTRAALIKDFDTKRQEFLSEKYGAGKGFDDDGSKNCRHGALNARDNLDAALGEALRMMEVRRGSCKCRCDHELVVIERMPEKF